MILLLQYLDQTEQATHFTVCPNFKISMTRVNVSTEKYVPKQFCGYSNSVLWLKIPDTQTPTCPN